jgi:hypothetical protein
MKTLVAVSSNEMWITSITQVKARFRYRKNIRNGTEALQILESIFSK